MGDKEEQQNGGGENEPAAPVSHIQPIPPVVVPAETRQLRFSFRHLDCTNPNFQLTDCSVEYLRLLLERIRDYSTWTVDDFCDQNNNEHRHVIDFQQTTEQQGFNNVDADQLAYHESWQFELCQNQDWRVHGILIDDTFYIVWLDVNHRLYPYTNPPAH